MIYDSFFSFLSKHLKIIASKSIKIVYMTVVKGNEVPLTLEKPISMLMGVFILSQTHLSFSLPGCLKYLLKIF